MTRFQIQKAKNAAAAQKWLADNPHLTKFSKLSELIDLDKAGRGELEIGDTVEVINGYGHLIKGYCVIAFEKKDDEVFVYIDWDCYWFSKPLYQVGEKEQPCQNRWWDGVEQLDED